MNVDLYKGEKLARATIVINRAPYGEETPWNALRLAQALIAKGLDVNIFLLGDGVSAAKKGQSTPHGYYNLEAMLVDLLKRGVKVGACGTCTTARGLGEEDIVEGIRILGMMDLANWVRDSQHVLTF